MLVPRRDEKGPFASAAEAMLIKEGLSLERWGFLDVEMMKMMMMSLHQYQLAV